MTDNQVPVVSIIVPVYNSKTYLPALIDSVLSQEFEDYELLLIDDGSNDGSEDICEQYALKSDKVRVIHKSNGGMCSSRNVGIREARGKYLMFCDNDDEVKQGFISDNVRLIIDNDADCVAFGALQEEWRGETLVRSIPMAAQNNLVLSGEGIFQHYGDVVSNGCCLWNMIYRKDLILSENLTFDEQLRNGCEDWIFNYQVYDLAQKIVINSKMYYIWKCRAQRSSSKKITGSYLLGISNAAKAEARLMRSHRINTMNPNLFAGRMTEYMRSALRMCVTGNSRVKYPDSLELMECLSDLYSDPVMSLQGVRLRLSDRIVLALLKRGNYRLLYVIVVFGFSLLHPKRSASFV